MSLSMKELQTLSELWARRNFGDVRPVHHPLLGIVEEVGELSHAHLKSEQGIRGTPEELKARAKDAVGDIIIFLADYCNLNNIDLQDAVDSAWAVVEKRNWAANKITGTVQVKDDTSLVDDVPNYACDENCFCTCGQNDKVVTDEEDKT